MRSSGVFLLDYPDAATLRQLFLILTDSFPQICWVVSSFEFVTVEGKDHERFDEAMERLSLHTLELVRNETAPMMNNATLSLLNRKGWMEFDWISLYLFPHGKPRATLCSFAAFSIDGPTCWAMCNNDPAVEAAFLQYAINRSPVCLNNLPYISPAFIPRAG